MMDWWPVSSMAARTSMSDDVREAEYFSAFESRFTNTRRNNEGSASTTGRSPICQITWRPLRSAVSSCCTSLTSTFRSTRHRIGECFELLHRSLESCRSLLNARFQLCVQRTEIIFSPLTSRHVVDDDQRRRTTAEPKRVRHELHVDHLP